MRRALLLSLLSLILIMMMLMVSESRGVACPGPKHTCRVQMLFLNLTPPDALGQEGTPGRVGPKPAFALRWAFDPQTFEARPARPDPRGTVPPVPQPPRPPYDRFRFPECGFELIRTMFNVHGTPRFRKHFFFSLPPTVDELVRRIQALPEGEVRQLLISGDTLTEEGAKLWKTIQATTSFDAIFYPTQDSPSFPRLPFESVDPTQLLMLAAVHPHLAQVLGLYFVDDFQDKETLDFLAFERELLQQPNLSIFDFTYEYEIIGRWTKTDKDTAICNDDSQLNVARFLIRGLNLKDLSPPLQAPVWVDRVFPAISAIEARRIEPGPAAIEETQRITGQIPQPIESVKPAVQLRWQRPENKSSAPITVVEAKDILIRPVGYNVYRGTEATFTLTTEAKVNDFLLLQDLFRTGTAEPLHPWIAFVDDDEKLKPGITYFYRLQTIDIFGRTALGEDTRSITFDFLPPFPPKFACLDSEYTISDLDGSCAFGNNWTSPADLYDKRGEGKQGDGRRDLGITVQWQWFDDDAINFTNAHEESGAYFKVYQFDRPEPCQTDGPPGRLELTPPEGPGGPQRPSTGPLRVPVRERREIYTAALTLTVPPNEAIVYRYFCITTVAKNMAGQEIESRPSITLMAYAVDKQRPDVSCAAQSSWKPKVPKTEEIDPQPNWEGKVSVRLTWPTSLPGAANADVVAYNIYRAFDEQVAVVVIPDKEGGPPAIKPVKVSDDPDLLNNEDAIGDTYLRLNQDPIQGGVFLDKIEAQARNKFYYKLKAIDVASNESEFSCASDPVQLPPQISKPLITQIQGGDGKVQLFWTTNPPSEEVTEYAIYRLKKDLTIESRQDAVKLAQDPANLTLLKTVRYSDYKEPEGLAVPAHARETVYYLVEARRLQGDKVVLSALSDPAAGRAYDATPPDRPMLDSAQLGTTSDCGSAKRCIVLKWTVFESKSQMAIWRSEDELWPRRMIVPLLDEAKARCSVPPRGPGDEPVGKPEIHCSFIDDGPEDLVKDELQPGTTYIYQVQAYDEFGNKSAFSDSKAVEIPPPCRLELSNFRVRDLFGFEVEVSVDYRFFAEPEVVFAQPPTLGATVFRQGAELPFFTFTPAQISAGVPRPPLETRTATIKVTYGENATLGVEKPPLTIESDEIQVFLSAGADECRRDFAKSFSFNKHWTLDDIFNFRVTELSNQGIEITIDYAYRSAQEGSVQMQAVVLQGGQDSGFFSSTTPTLDSGINTTTLRVTYGSNNPPLTFTSDAVRLEMFISLTVPVTFFSKTFDFRRVWTLPRPPTIRDIQITPASADPGQQVSIIVRASDPDNDLEKVSINATSLGAGDLTVQRTAPETFRASLTLKKPLQDRAYELKITAVDARGNTSETITKTLTVQNVAPSILGIMARNAEGNPGDSVVFTLELEVRDNNADDTSQGRTEVLAQGITLTQPVTLRITPALSSLPAQLIAFDPNQGLYTFRFVSTNTGSAAISKPHPAGQFAVSITVQDDDNAQVQSSFAFTVHNVQPMIEGLTVEPSTVRVGDGQLVQVSATISDDNGVEDIARVIVDARDVGGSLLTLTGNQFSRISDRTIRATTPQFAHINQTGTFTITAFAEDRADTRSDSRSVTITVQPPLLPDLTLRSTFSPSSPELGASLTFDVIVTNQGKAAAGPFSVEVRGASGPISQNVSGLPVGNSTRLSLTRPCSVPNESFIVRVDPDNRVPESNENNNGTTINVTCLQIPVLTLSTMSLSFRGEQGSSIAPQSFRVTNTGQGMMTWSATPPDPYLTVFPAGGQLSAGQGVDVAVSVSALLLAGSYRSNITVEAPGARGSPRSVDIFIEITPAIVRLTIEAICTDCGIFPVQISVFIQVNGVPGATPFTRDVTKGTSVTVSAPPTVGNEFVFQFWRHDGLLVNPDSPSPIYSFTATANALLQAYYKRTPQVSPCNTDFSESVLDPAFTPYVPKRGPTLSLTDNPGHLRLDIPSGGTAGVTFDHWTNVDEAPQLRCSAPSGSWEMSTRLKVLSPTDQQDYHVGLMVVFSQFDLFYWGIYRGAEIRMETSGSRPGISAPLSNPNEEIELMIAKQDDIYSFSYRPVGSNSWTLVGQLSRSESPQFLGLIGKTWSPVRLVVDFDYLHVQVR